MSFRFSREGNAYNALRKGFVVGGLISSVAVLFCLFHPNFYWLERLGLLGVIFFSTGNVVLIYWPKETGARLKDDEQGGTPQ
jgi:hypothetical protein